MVDLNGATINASDTTDALARLAGGVSFDGAIDGASALASQLGVSLGIAQQIAIITSRSNLSAPDEVFDPRSPNYNPELQASANRRAELDKLRKSFEDQNAASFGGGGTGAGGGIASNTDQREESLTALQSMLGPDDPTEAIEEWYETAMTALEEARLLERGMMEEHNDYKLEIERLYQSQLSKIQADEHSARIAELGGFFGSMATIAETGGAKMAKIAATFSGAQAMMAAYEAAMKAAAEAKTIPGRLAAYAMFIAKGVKTVQAIKKAGDSPSSVGVGAGGGQATAAPPQTQNVTIDLVGATGQQIEQFQAFADTFNEASRQGLMTNVTVRGT